jgi:histidine triad (HIT) family protein
MSDDCIFCAIVAGTAPAHRVAETDRALAFMDIFPASRGHTLVIPKAHSANLFEIDDASVQAVASLARRAALALREFRRPDGMAVYQANGRAAFQTVFHYHVHLIPRLEGEAMAFHGRARAEDPALAEIAREIAARLPAT